MKKKNDFAKLMLLHKSVMTKHNSLDFQYHCSYVFFSFNFKLF
jgi:hypothetical protein